MSLPLSIRRMEPVTNEFNDELISFYVYRLSSAVMNMDQSEVLWKDTELDACADQSNTSVSG